MSLWYMFCTIVALVAVDRLGRKPLLLLGTLGMTVGMAILGALFHWHTTGMYVVFDDVSRDGRVSGQPGPVDLVDHVGDISQPAARQSDGRGVGVRLDGVVPDGQFLSSDGRLVQDHFGTPAMAFWIYAVMSAAAFLFSLIVVPETKGRTLEEIGASWNKTTKHTQGDRK